MTKKTGIFDNMGKNTGVFDLDSLIEKTKEVNGGQKKKIVRICIYAPIELRQHYKSLLAKMGKTVQDDLIEYIKSKLIS